MHIDNINYNLKISGTIHLMSFRNELRSRIIDNEELYKHLTRDEFNNIKLNLFEYSKKLFEEINTKIDQFIMSYVNPNKNHQVRN